MAHVQKNNRVATGHLFDHYGRNAEDEKYRSNDSIDPERTCLNYNLAPNKESQEERLAQRLSEVKVLKRKDVNVMCSWVVTAPKDLDVKQEKEFFKETYKFLKDRYGGEKNVISAYVHKDETSPHMHFAFVPVTIDKKKNIEKVSAKEVVTKLDLQSFHDDLQKHLDKAKIRCNVLNGATKEGNRSIKELKRSTAKEELKSIQREQQKALENLEELKGNINTLESDYNGLEAVKSEILDIDDIEAKKSLTGSKITIKAKDYNKLVELAKKSVYSENKIEMLERENKTLDKARKGFYDSNYELRQENYKLRGTVNNYKKHYSAMYKVLERNDLLKDVQKEFKAPKISIEKSIGIEK